MRLIKCGATARPLGKSGKYMASHHVLVSGATGFFGSHLLSALRATPDITVTALVRGHGDTIKGPQTGEYRIVAADITDGSAVRSALEKAQPTHVINAATYGVNPTQRSFTECAAVNVGGTYNLLCAAADVAVQRFIQIGTYFEYGANAGPMHESAQLQPHSTYAATKAGAGLLLRDRCICGDMETVIARAFHLWGPGESSHRLTPQIIQACTTHTPLDLTDGLQVKDFTYVKDAARWVSALTLYDAQLPYREFNIAGGLRASVREFATAIADELGNHDTLRFGRKPMPTREPPSGIADTHRLQETLGNLYPTETKAAIQETIVEFAS